MLESFNPELHGGEAINFPPVGLEVGALSNWSVTELKGMFGKAGKAVSIEDMNQAIALRGGSGR